MTAADLAVKYILDRIQTDPDLAWYMLHTEAMHLCCVAEAERLGKPIEEVELERLRRPLAFPPFFRPYYGMPN